PRLLAAWRFQQPWSAAFLHPLAVTVLLAIQWIAFANHWFGRPSSWKGRTYKPATITSPVRAR
ncbi:MAG TPA: hypothetical protein PKA41_07400, partial [Verrucomicrobiota bacterium]|nr:hypothetical protein [Verrucomicrobiota bacterium]